MGTSSSKAANPAPRERTRVPNDGAAPAVPAADTKTPRKARAEFQLVSPHSDLSNPSDPGNRGGPLPTNHPYHEENEEGRILVMENVPPPKGHIKSNRAKERPRNRREAPRRQTSFRKTHRVIQKYMRGCLEESAHQLDRARMQTSQAVQACMEENNTKETMKQCMRQVVEAVHLKKKSQQDVAQPNHENKSKKNVPRRKVEWRSTNVEQAEVETKREQAEVETKKMPYEPIWRESNGMMPSLYDEAERYRNQTPNDAVDRAYASAMGLYKEDDYFNRLAVAEQSPYCKAVRANGPQKSSSQAVMKGDLNADQWAEESSPIVKLFSAEEEQVDEAPMPARTSAEGRNDLNPSLGARKRESRANAESIPTKQQPRSHAGKHEEARQSSKETVKRVSIESDSEKGGDTRVVSNEPKPSVPMEKPRIQAASRSIIRKVSELLAPVTAEVAKNEMNTEEVIEKEPDEKEEVRGPKLASMLAATLLTADGNAVVRSFDYADLSTGSDCMSLRVTESAPCVLETRDYRNIAMATSECEPDDIRPNESNLETQMNYNPMMSPSASSVASSVGQSPMVSDQALCNAAFLFSPSFVGGNQRISRRPETTRESSFSISTFDSRNRLSTVSSRSRPAFSIPISSAQLPSDSSRISYGVEESSFERRLSKAGSERHVRFSEANEMFILGKNTHARLHAPEIISTQAIESKVSDLSDTGSVFGNDGGRVQSIFRSKDTQESLSRHVEESSQRDAGSTNGDMDTPEKLGSSYSDVSSYQSLSKDEADPSDKPSVHWTYREENGQLSVATPVMSRKAPATGGRLTPTNSPMIRFRAAKTKFSNPSEKRTPARKTPPKRFSQRISTSSVVSSRITEINGRLRSSRPVVRKNPRRETGGDNALAPRKGTLVNPLFRNPVIMSYKDGQPYGAGAGYSDREEKGHEDSRSLKGIERYEEQPSNHAIDTAEHAQNDQASYNHSPNRQDDGTHVQEHEDDATCETNGSTATSGRVRDIFSNLTQAHEEPLLGRVEDDDDDSSEDGDDPFAHIMGAPSVDESEAPTVATLRRDSSIGRSVGIQSKPSVDESRGSLGVRSLRLAASDERTEVTVDKENCKSRISSTYNYLPFSSKAQVNPREQRHHAHAGNLCLSPLQRTPMQARKWRTLAAAAQEKDRLKKGSSKKQQRKGGGLQARSINIRPES